MSKKWINLSEQFSGFNNYEISNLGKVKNIITGKIIKGWEQKGYQLVKLRSVDKSYRSYFVHTLVLRSFQLDLYFVGAVIDHLNSIKNDNRLENLRWCSKAENNSYMSHKISKKLICIDENNNITYFNSIKEAANILNIDKSMITHVLAKRKSSTSGFYFEEVTSV